MFPEGTRSPDGRVGVFKGGSFYLAMQAGLPIVPLSIIGSRHVMRKGQLTTRPGHVTLIVHDPIATSANAEPSTTEVRALARRVREIVAAWRRTREAQADASRLASARDHLVDNRQHRHADDAEHHQLEVLLHDRDVAEEIAGAGADAHPQHAAGRRCRA